MTARVSISFKKVTRSSLKMNQKIGFYAIPGQSHVIKGMSWKRLWFPPRYCCLVALIQKLILKMLITVIIEKVKSVLQAIITLCVNMMQKSKHGKIKIHRYIRYYAAMNRDAKRNRILMQKTTPTHKTWTNATNVHYQQYSSYNDTPNMKAKLFNQNHCHFRSEERTIQNTNADMD